MPGMVSEAAVEIARLRAIIAEKSLTVGQAVTLTSGASSQFYFNMKHTAFDPVGALLIADAILAALPDKGVDWIGGMELGAVPIVACVALRSAQIGRPVPSFFVRKEAKAHGSRKRIEPEPSHGARVVLIEDVTTTGGSTLKAAQAVREHGCHVDTAITVVDRLEGAEANLAEAGIRLIPILTARDFAIADG